MIRSRPCDPPSRLPSQRWRRERDEAVATAHDIRIELTTRADQVKDLRETIKALRAEISDEKKRLERAESARHKFEVQAHALSVELKTMTGAHDRLDKALAEKGAAFDQMNAAHEALQKEHAALSRAHTDLEAAVARQAEAAEQDQTLIQELRGAQAVLEKRAIEAEQRQATADASATAMIDGLEARLADQQRVIDSLIEKVGV